MPDAAVNPDHSPKWGPTIKLVVGLTSVAIVAALLISFRDIVGPLLLALILSYFLHPLVSLITEKTRLPWRTAVNIIYLFVVVMLITFFTLTGVAIVQEAQNLVGVVSVFVTELPMLVTDLSTQSYQIGPFTFAFDQILGQYDLNALVDQVLGIVQPVLGRAGGMVTALAGRTAATLGWGFFILLVSYFTLVEGGQVSFVWSEIDFPGYAEDLRRLAAKLGKIWNAFMRGQLLLFVVTSITFFLLMSILGLRNALVLALLAGIARFVPYVGPFITWTVIGVVALFQPGNYFGLESWQYILLVLGIVILADQIFDNLVTPRLYGSTLGVHPGAVLVAAIVAANLIGFVGLLLAAPVLASLTLFGKYAFRKMLDLNPWPDVERVDESAGSGSGIFARPAVWIKNLRRKRNEQTESGVRDRDDRGDE